MEKQIKVASSPATSPIETAGHIVIALHTPYSEKNVTVQINPNIQDYQENADQPGIQVRQVMVMTDTDDTKILNFDFEGNNKQSITVDNTVHEIQLTNIGKEEFEGQQFPFFEFLVKWQD